MRDRIVFDTRGLGQTSKLLLEDIALEALNHRVLVLCHPPLEARELHAEFRGLCVRKKWLVKYQPFFIVEHIDRNMGVKI